MTGEAWPMSNVLILQELFTNEAFLRHLFGERWRGVQVCFVAGDPERAHRGAWAGHPAEQMLQMRGQELLNAYFSVGGSARSLPDFVDLRVIVLDDVGTKVSLSEAELLLGPPTWVLETSPGNHQAGWCIEPVVDRDRALGLVKGVYEALGGHGDNLKNVVGWMRLPIGSNGKTKYLADHVGGFRHRMVVWNPSVKLDTSSWAVTSVGLGPGFGHAEMPDPGEVESDAILQAFRLLGRVQGLGRRTTMGWGYDVECPWQGEHTDRVHEGAVYVPVLGRFCCHHGHCQDKGVGEVRVRLDELLKDAGLGVSVAALEFDDEVFEAEAEEAEADEDDPDLGSYPPIEYGAAQAFADRYRNELRFDHTRGRGFRWTGGYWREDRTEYAFSLVCDFAQAFGRAHPGLKGTGSTRYATAVYRQAKAHPLLSTDGTQWDLDPWRVGAPGCEINLKTGAIEEPNPAHLITKQLLVAPADMPTPLWDRFLWESTGGDPGVITFLQAWSGYCLTGDTAEEVFAFLYGPGGNGKGTFLHTVNAIVHDYAARASADMFMVRLHEPHSEEIARLAGVRLVSASEIQQGRTFNVVRLKDFTGRDGPQEGAFKYGHTFEYMPQFKIVFVGNNQPRLDDVDDAIRRRVILIPFTQKPKAVDTTLKDRLVAEYPGILMWMIRGEQLRRDSGGLSALVPTAVMTATRDYLEGQDTLKNWSAERCVFDPAEQMGVMEALEDYRAWCHGQGKRVELGMQDFSLRCVAEFPGCQKKPHKNKAFLFGVGLLPQDV